MLFKNTTTIGLRLFISSFPGIINIGIFQRTILQTFEPVISIGTGNYFRQISEIRGLDTFKVLFLLSFSIISNDFFFLLSK
jgi:hypothetical protein